MRELGQVELADPRAPRPRRPGGRSRRRTPGCRCACGRRPARPPGESGPGPTARAGVARRDAEAELRVVLAGADELVGVGLDAGRDPDQHLRDDGRPRRGSAREPVELVEAVDDDATDAGPPRRRAARRATCCCRAGRAGRPGTPAASATCSSPPVATSRCMPSSWASRAIARHRNALVGVRDAVAERGDRLAAPGPEVGLVVHEQRRAEARRRARAGRSPPIASRPSAPIDGGVGQQVPRQRRSRGARPAHRAHIGLRGAETPSRSRPMAQARPRAASTSHSRAWVSSGGTSPIT